MSKMDCMLKPLVIGCHTMANRFVMAPLTRCRADADHVPTDAMVRYYSDRTGFGLIISEATQIQKGYSAFVREGGIYGDAQISGWKKVTDAVHAKGGLIFCQIHHCGRATVPCNLDKGMKVVAPSTCGIINHSCSAGFAADNVKQPYPAEVHALTKEEIAVHVQLYATAAKNAIAAGFDGVEIHGANGYLIDQFLKETSNKRTDEYGGSFDNRCRFMLEVVDAVGAAIGFDRVGLRISPLNTYNDSSDTNAKALTQHLCKELNSRNLAFLDVVRGDFVSPARGADEWAREVYTGVLFTGLGFELEEAEGYVSEKKADAVCFGVKAIANPDLVKRAIAGAALNEPDANTFYTRTEEGYNTYPCM